MPREATWLGPTWVKYRNGYQRRVLFQPFHSPLVRAHSIFYSDLNLNDVLPGRKNWIPWLFHGLPRYKFSRTILRQCGRPRKGNREVWRNHWNSHVFDFSHEVSLLRRIRAEEWILELEFPRKRCHFTISNDLEQCTLKDLIIFCN